LALPVLGGDGQITIRPPGSQLCGSSEEDGSPSRKRRSTAVTRNVGAGSRYN